MIPPATTTEPAALTTLGVVSFLNARPLYKSLIGNAAYRIQPAVPSRLADMLDGGRCDAALLPIVDYWRTRDRLAAVSNCCIAGDGETMTVRVFSNRPPDQIRSLHVDGDSHTSVILAQLLWRELYDRRLELTTWRSRPAGAATNEVEAILLIGDKVVKDAPRGLGFGFEVDLGAAWKHLTGLPFVFASWYGRRDANHARLAAALESARDAGVAAAEQIALEEGPDHGWPQALAVRYLRDTMRYTLTDPMRAATDRFFSLCTKHDLLR